MKDLLEFTFKSIINYLLVISFIFVNLALILSFVKVIIEHSIPIMFKSCIADYYTAKLAKAAFKKQNTIKENE